MQAQLEEMGKRLDLEKTTKKKPTVGKTPKNSRPSPSTTAASKSSKPSCEGGNDESEPDMSQGSGSESGEDGNLSLAAKKNRLRRLCERKPSGKIQVPESIHEMWLKAGHSRDQLLEELENANWDKD